MVMLVEVVHPIIHNMTDAAIDSICETTTGDWELICYVHGENGLHIPIKDGRVIVIHDPEPLSIARGYNKAVKHAKGDVICLVHNDIITHCYGWNRIMEKIALEGDVAFPMVDESIGECEKRGVAKTEPWQTSSCCYMISKETWEDMDGLDEDYENMHGEDIDFYKRCETAGKRLVRCDPVVIHYRGVSRSFVPDKANKLFFDNWMKYNAKHGIKPGEDSLPRISVEPDVRIEEIN